MLQNIMTALGLKSDQSSGGNGGGGDGFASRRSYPRRTCDQVVSFLNGKAHPVLDWSPGGLRVYADVRPVAVGEEMDVEMKFHLRDELIALSHRAKVVRKGMESISLQFLPLSGEMLRTFQQVIDDFNVREFAGSQAT